MVNITDWSNQRIIFFVKDSYVYMPFTQHFKQFLISLNIFAHRNSNFSPKKTILQLKQFIDSLLFRPLLIEMLFIITDTHWKQKRIIATFNLIIFYCLKTFYNIKFIKYFSSFCLFLYQFWFLFKIFQWKRFICLLTKQSALSSI